MPKESDKIPVQEVGEEGDAFSRNSSLFDDLRPFLWADNRFRVKLLIPLLTSTRKSGSPE